MDLKSTYNKIAEDWVKDHQVDTWPHEGIDKFICLLKSGDLVLDLGCGGGTYSKYLLDKGLKVTGIDFSEKMIEIAKRNAPAGKFLVMDIRDLKKLPQTFEGIFAQASLLHISKKEIENVLKRLNEKLKPEGYFYIAVKEIGSGGKEKEIIVDEKYGYRYQRFFSFFTLDEIKNYLKDLKMEIVYENVFPFEKINWIQVIGRKPK